MKEERVDYSDLVGSFSKTPNFNAAERKAIAAIRKAHIERHGTPFGVLGALIEVVVGSAVYLFDENDEWQKAGLLATISMLFMELAKRRNSEAARRVVNSVVCANRNCGERITEEALAEINSMLGGAA